MDAADGVENPVLHPLITQETTALRAGRPIDRMAHAHPAA
jgi:hypothetical protein